MNDARSDVAVEWGIHNEDGSLFEFLEAAKDQLPPNFDRSEWAGWVVLGCQFCVLK